jgi:hypothetical protein
VPYWLFPAILPGQTRGILQKALNRFLFLDVADRQKINQVGGDAAALNGALSFYDFSLNYFPDLILERLGIMERQDGGIDNDRNLMGRAIY